MMYHNSFYGPFHFLLTAVGWIIVVAIIIMVLRSMRPGGWHHRHGREMMGDRGMDILRERYA